ncbi:MAG: N-6 DNA methylase, partial [bacterium]|nr:N-6 DNA methylase [bacterium]
MALSWNEIKQRAVGFSKEWENETREDAEAKSFWDAFFNIFGITRRRLASFEEPVKLLKANRRGFIDLFWKGTLLVEHKSAGEDLDAAFTQAVDYFEGIQERDLPQYILVSDFRRIRLYDLETRKYTEFPLKDLHKQVRRFGFIAGYESVKIKPEDQASIKAAELMGKLADTVAQAGYTGHELKVFLVRLLFCLFADDSGIFNKDIFRQYMENRTSVDGSDTGLHLVQIFEVLNTPAELRQKNLDENLLEFPYVNGGLFSETLHVPAFNRQMREAILDAAGFDWSKISPAIFGSLFQSVMDPEARRHLGAHYTSETNILKVIKPLFLDPLWEEFENAKRNPKKLTELHKKLANLKFLDPACGCGNFLVVAYRELRILELEIIKTRFRYSIARLSSESVVMTDVDQFYGIELEEFPARIAEVAMWLTDHQMNVKFMEEFGNYFMRLPLKKSPHITISNALLIDWGQVIPKSELNYIMGNPPFGGSKLMSETQRKEITDLFGKDSGAGVLDYVAGWYIKSAQFIQGTQIKVALVSTNSITQGEQVGILWKELLKKQGVKVHFAHRTFKWSNEARGKAAVYCVIIGFANFEIDKKYLYEYENVKGIPHEIQAKNINPYLVDAPDIVLEKRQKPISNVPGMSFGSMPNDNGNLLLSESERVELVVIAPQASKYIRPFLSAKEFLNSGKRWCLWLLDVTPEELKSMPDVLKR